MIPYIPKLTHAIITAFLCIGFMLLGAKMSSRLAMALNMGALIFAIMTVIVLWMLVVQTMGEHLERQTRFAEVFNSLDEESRRALAFQFPSMRYRMKRGIVRPYFENTDVPIEMFRHFLQTSNDKYVSPRRDWYTAERPEWAWQEIMIWLEENEKVVPESAAGSHSWLWKGTAYQQLMAYWMAGRKVVDMGEMKAYAYNIPPPPPLEDAGGG